ncbi:MAG: hypothetical protein UE295_07530, partial [Acutalibacteraceae bacterium]|nr:hypothetical protein [Acutalibacteraceae bacterium]
PETASTQYDNNGYSEDNFSATDSTSYDNSTYNDRQYPETASTQYDNNGYSEDNFSATDNTSYDNSTYNDRQYPETASTQYNNNHYSTPATLSYNKYNDKQDDNMKGDLPFSIYNGYNNSRYSTKAYQAAKAQRNYNYTDSSTAYGEQSVYNKYKKTPYYTDETRERANRSINNFIMVVRLIPILVFAIIYLVVSLYDTGMIVDKKRSNIEASTAVQATQPVIPTAELSGSLNTIINEDGKPFAVSYHPPEEYTFLDNGLDSYALFESNICGKTVSLTTIFFNGNFEEELDYYKKLGERSGTTVEINTYDKDLGNVTDIKISTNGKGISRQLFIEVEKECVVYVSMTNIPFEYADEAEKLIELLVEDMWVTYPEEVTTEEVTEAPTE